MGFRVLDLGVLGFRVLGLLFRKVKKDFNPAEGFEHVKGYAGLAAGKPRACSEDDFCCSEMQQIANSPRQ